MTITTPQELLERTIFNNQAAIAAATKEINKALSRKADVKQGFSFPITLELSSDYKELVRDLLTKAGYFVRHMQTDSHRNESYVTVDLMIPPQGE